MAVKGFVGKLLFLDLGKGTLTEEQPDEEALKKYLGGYGLGAYVLYTRQKAKVDPLGPQALLGFVSGPLSGTEAITGNRYQVVAKSPKTGTWGDANSGGTFATPMKQAGFDGIFFSGISEKPVYLVIDDGKSELRDAAGLWGKDTNEVDDILRAEFGTNAGIACIGPVGERANLLAAIINDKGRAAGRSGLGAVMGSKKLKAIVVRGSQEIPVADPAGLKATRQEVLAHMKEQPWWDIAHKYGTSGITAGATAGGDTPNLNWQTPPTDDFKVGNISDDAVLASQKKRFACWRCPIGCGGHVEVDTAEYKAKGHKPEYETLGAFGNMCGNDNYESIVEMNNICNLAGMDTISAGCTMAFACECFEKGIITKNDTGGLDLAWGNHRDLVELLRQMARGEGFGKVLADGSQKASERIGKGSEQYVMAIRGEEVAMHDPRCWPSLAVSYKMDATPGRHTQAGAWFAESKWCPQDMPIDSLDQRYNYSGKGRTARVLSAFGHFVNSGGLCLFAAVIMRGQHFPAFFNSVMGTDYTLDDLLEIGDRIATLRVAFNLREGLHNVNFTVPGRILGDPPLKSGPTAKVTVDNETQVRDYLQAMGWDPQTGVPTAGTLQRLGLDFVAEDLASLSS